MLKLTSCLAQTAPLSDFFVFLMKDIGRFEFTMKFNFSQCFYKFNSDSLAGVDLIHAHC